MFLSTADAYKLKFGTEGSRWIHAFSARIISCTFWVLKQVYLTLVCVLPVFTPLTANSDYLKLPSPLHLICPLEKPSMELYSLIPPQANRLCQTPLSYCAFYWIISLKTRGPAQVWKGCRNKMSAAFSYHVPADGWRCWITTPNNGPWEY